MARPPRDFRPAPLSLEGRRLPASGLAKLPFKELVQFRGDAGPASASPAEQVVGQQDGVAAVVLSRPDARGIVRVRVATDPSSPAVGVNVDAVGRTVTFSNGQGRAVVDVPLVAGAPNPGEVDVNLVVAPITGNVEVSGPLTLKVLASGAGISPKVVSVEGKPRGIVLTFSKPMDPAGAANIDNYAVRWTSMHSKYAGLGPFALLMPGPWPPGSSETSGWVQIRSARYDPSTRSVTLIPAREIRYKDATTLTISAGRASGVPGRPTDPQSLGPDLVDLAGNPIRSMPGATPGGFSSAVAQGDHSTL